MATRLKCRCRQTVAVTDDAAQGTVTCPECGRALAVPPPVPCHFLIYNNGTSYARTLAP